MSASLKTDVQTDVQAAIDAGMVLGQIRGFNEAVFVTLPAGAQVHSLEHMLVSPSRPRGTVALRDQRSFVSYVRQRRSDPQSARIYGVQSPEPGFTAVFNDHDLGSPGWRDDRATFDCPLSREWQTWMAASGKQMTQEDFARFMEDNLPDVADPPAADMLEISRSLEAKKKVNFASGLRLSNGQHQITYEESIEGTAAKGRLMVPETFALGIAVFEGGDRYRVEARLRYRIADGGKMTMWYDLLRPHKVLEDALQFVWKSIETDLGCEILNGGIVS
jgi:uncharacterized protein YfdQ (DUF2303 family)